MGDFNLGDNSKEAVANWEKMERRLARNIDAKMRKASGVLLTHVKSEIGKFAKNTGKGLFTYFEKRTVTREKLGRKLVSVGGVIGKVNHPSNAYAKIQDEGSKGHYQLPTKKNHASFFAIPTKAMRTSGGASRGFARQVFRGELAINNKIDKTKTGKSKLFQITKGSNSHLPTGAYAIIKGKLTMLYRYMYKLPSFPGHRYSEKAKRRARHEIHEKFNGLLR